MTKRTTELSVLARRAVHALPMPMANVLRDARRAVLNLRSRREVFRQIAQENSWEGSESVSGPGSSMQGTSRLRSALPTLLKKYNIQSILDIPCGDAYWIREILSSNINYIGADIVPELIIRNCAEKSDLGRFEVLDLVSDPLPRVDLILVRDCFIHLPNRMVSDAIDNIRKSSSNWLLTSHFLCERCNVKIEIGGYRPIDLTKSPFKLPDPAEIVDDSDGLNANGKHMALWRIGDI
jgi:hypothetical protein